MNETEAKPCDWSYFSDLLCCELPSSMRFRLSGDKEWRHRCEMHRRQTFFNGAEIEIMPDSLRKIVNRGDIEQLVADAESKVDDLFADEHDVLTDLLARLRSIAGLDSLEYDAPVLPLTIGRRDECLISVPHSHEFCGKPEAHR